MYHAVFEVKLGNTYHVASDAVVSDEYAAGAAMILGCSDTMFAGLSLGIVPETVVRSRTKNNPNPARLTLTYQEG